MTNKEMAVNALIQSSEEIGLVPTLKVSIDLSTVVYLLTVPPEIKLLLLGFFFRDKNRI